MGNGKWEMGNGKWEMKWDGERREERGGENDTMI